PSEPPNEKDKPTQGVVANTLSPVPWCCGLVFVLKTRARAEGGTKEGHFRRPVDSKFRAMAGRDKVGHPTRSYGFSIPFARSDCIMEPTTGFEPVTYGLGTPGELALAVKPLSNTPGQANIKLQTLSK